MPLFICLPFAIPKARPHVGRQWEAQLIILSYLLYQLPLLLRCKDRASSKNQRFGRQRNLRQEEEGIAIIVSLMGINSLDVHLHPMAGDGPKSCARSVALPQGLAPSNLLNSLATTSFRVIAQEANRFNPHLAPVGISNVKPLGRPERSYTPRKSKPSGVPGLASKLLHIPPK